MLNYINTVQRFVIDNFLFGDGQDLNANTSFMGEGIIDSTGILELIMFLEETYEISIEDNEMVPDNLDSLQKISLFLDKKLQPCSAEQTI